MNFFYYSFIYKSIIEYYYKVIEDFHSKNRIQVMCHEKQKYCLKILKQSLENLGHQAHI